MRLTALLVLLHLASSGFILRGTLSDGYCNKRFDNTHETRLVTCYVLFNIHVSESPWTKEIQGDSSGGAFWPVQVLETLWERSQRLRYQQLGC